MKYILIPVIILLAVCGLLPSNTFAADVDTVAPTSGSSCAPGKLCNPLKYDNIQQLIPALLDIVAQIGLVICTFFIILAGFGYVTAGGNVEKIKKAHNVLMWSIIGTAVLLGAKVLATILSNTVNQIIK